MLIKAGVDISRLNREIRRAMPKVAHILWKYEKAFIITSTYEGSHGIGSLHYGNDAFDCRGPKVNRSLCITELKGKLGRHYDVVNEADHIHIEWDPKN